VKLALALVCLSTAAWAGPAPWIGLALEDGDAGAKVRQVMDSSPAQRAGIKEGEQVVALDTIATPNPATLIKAVLASGVGKKVTLHLVDAKHKPRTVAITLEAKPASDELQRGGLIGKPAPDFEPLVQAGAKLPKISALKGQVILIDFFATWCGPCVAMMPHIQSLHEKLGPKGLKVLGVSTEAAGIVAGAAELFHLTYPLASDASEIVSRIYRVYALPTMVIIDRQGIVREVSVADPEAADAAIEAALRAK
jgi:peroxiredoxin